VKAQTTPRHRVLLVREWDQQMAGSGCCGRLDTSAVEAVTDLGDDPFAHCRPDMVRVGAAYAALRERFPEDEVEITVVDPRNTAWLLPAIWRDARRRGLSVGSTLRQVNRGTAACVLICDGLVLTQDAPPAEAVAAVEADLSTR
jgi:hypothetical protein